MNWRRETWSSSERVRGTSITSLNLNPAAREQGATPAIVQLRRNSPELEQKATLTVVRTAGEHRYYLGDLPLDKRAHLVLSPGCHHLYVLILGEMVPIGEVVLEADVDYLACLGDL